MRTKHSQYELDLMSPMKILATTTGGKELLHRICYFSVNFNYLKESSHGDQKWYQIKAPLALIRFLKRFQKLILRLI